MSLACRAAAAARIRPGLRAAVDWSHLGEDALQLLGADDVLVIIQAVIAFVGDRLLEVGEDLGAARIVTQLRLGIIEVRAQRLVRPLLHLVGVAVQADSDHCTHDDSPGDERRWPATTAWTLAPFEVLWSTDLF